MQAEQMQHPTPISALLARLVRDEDGATHIEYALLAIGLSLLILGGLTAVSSSLQAFFNSTATTLSSIP